MSKTRKAAHFKSCASCKFVSQQTIVLNATIFQNDIVQDNRAERNDLQVKAKSFDELYKTILLNAKKGRTFQKLCFL